MSLPFKDGMTKKGEANFGGASAWTNKSYSDVYKRLRVSGYLFLSGTTPGSTLIDPPKQKMNWPCIVCEQKFDTFKEYIAHGCGAIRPVTGAFKPKEAAN